MLLRLSIGWHFATEGVFKIMSTPEGKSSVLARYFPASEGPAFTSEEYLRASSGPFSEQFRQLVPDVESRDRLNPTRLKEQWQAGTSRIGQHFGFDPEQRNAADSLLKIKQQQADDYFAELETQKKIKKYFDDLGDIATVDRNPDSLSFERERTNDARRRVESERKGLVKPLLDWEKELTDNVVALASKEQVEREGYYVTPLTDLNKVDRITMCGTAIVGVALMIGFLTPVAALGGAGFLLLFYLSMPPLPGLPVGPKAEGHYIYVNKNLIEMFACLALAATPSGLWFGVDAFLFGWINRIGRRNQAETAIDEELDDLAASRAARRKPRR